MGPCNRSLTIRLTKEELDDLERLSKALDRSKGWILREGLKTQRALLADLEIALHRDGDSGEWVSGDELRKRLGLEG